MKCPRWALFHLSSAASISPPANQVWRACMLGPSAVRVCTKLFAQCIYVLLRLSPTIAMSRHPPPLSFCFLSPRSQLFPSKTLSLHNISSSAIWTQVALGHDRLSSHIMVKKAARETERDEKWREDNQCGSPQKLWKQTVQFRCPSLAVSLSSFSIFSSNSSSDEFCRPVYDGFM